MNRLRTRAALATLLVAYLAGMPSPGLCQPHADGTAILFMLADAGYSSVSVVGDFNGWSKEEGRLTKSGAMWSISRSMLPGIYQYKFAVNGTEYINDPRNPVQVENYNKSGTNSVFVWTENGRVELTAISPAQKFNPRDHYPKPSERKAVYLNIIWHQHQPLYLNPATDQLDGPWVRTHATKDYYDMAAMLQNYPDVHCNINLTSSLLYQLHEYYVKRLRPFIDASKNRFNVEGFLRAYGGRTDPWIDLMVKETARFDSVDKKYLLHNTWSAFGISEVQIGRFPEYEALKNRLVEKKENARFTEQEMRTIKFFFYLAHFDPDFLSGAVKLPDGTVCDLSEYVEFHADKQKYVLRRSVTENDCKRILIEAYKVMANVIPIHKALRYDPVSLAGQVEIITTPFYHPILPLIYDSDLARTCQPNDALPARFSYPNDAEAQVVKSVKFYTKIFGAPPTGMWPGEGSVAQPVLNILRENNIVWTATDVKVLKRSEPVNQPNVSPYRFGAGVDKDGKSMSMALVFRDTDLSDRIGFKYQNYEGEEAAEDFIQTVLSFAPKKDESDVLITVILDGENAWEWYRKDIDGKKFLNAFYRKLSALFRSGQVITTTTTEYLHGNPRRNIAPHPVEQLPKMQKLWPGSWINANYDTWIGEPEENKAWGYLLRAREDLEKTQLNQPDPKADPPMKDTKAYYAYMAYEAMYAAEGSDWFWWYGNDQSAPAGDKPFDEAFRTHLKNVYKFAGLAGAKLEMPQFDAIITAENASGQGVMAQSTDELQRVLFTVDASLESVPVAVSIVGNLPQLGVWTPNAVQMYDDGSHGDAVARDGVWSLVLDIPLGVEVQYKFTKGGKKGEWIPGEEFPSAHRTLTVTTKSMSPIIIKDTFGKQ